MIVFHMAITAAPDYATKREAHRRAHLERIQGLRAAGICLAGGPAPDGKTADIVYRLQRPEQVKFAMEEDPYWTGGVWTHYEPRSFAQFVEPWEMPPVVVDGSRTATIVEGLTTDHDMAQFILIDLRGSGKMHLGGFFEDGETFALINTPDEAQARAWFAETGFWDATKLRTRPLLHAL